MSNRTANLLKALFGFFIFLGCFMSKVSGGAGSWAFAGAVVGLFICISYIRKAFDKYS